MAGSIAGCLGSGSSGEPEYESGDVSDDIDGEERTTEEMTAAEALANQEPQADLAAIEVLSIHSHEFVFEEDYTGSTVQGTAENTGDERLSSAEVRVRVYNDDGELLGMYLDTTSDFDGGTEWNFEVIVLESPDDIAGYDIAIVGLPD
jgi:hypothetical protein